MSSIKTEREIIEWLAKLLYKVEDAYKCGACMDFAYAEFQDEVQEALAEANV